MRSLLCELWDSLGMTSWFDCRFIHMGADVGLDTHMEPTVNVLHGWLFCFLFLSCSIITICRSLTFSIIFPFLFPLPFSFPLSIVQVPRITSVWPRTPFRPLFSTIQTASLLSSHPFEAAMFGVAGAMYYLCERAFTSRWKSSKVGLFMLVLGIILLYLFDSDASTPALCKN